MLIVTKFSVINWSSNSNYINQLTDTNKLLILTLSVNDFIDWSSQDHMVAYMLTTCNLLGSEVRGQGST